MNKQKRKKVISNRSIDALLMGSDWAIDFDFGVKMLNKYLHQLDLLDSGVSYSDLGFSKQRESSKPTLLNSDGHYLSSVFNFSPDGENRNSIPEGSIAKLNLSGTMTVEDGMSHYGIQSMADNIREINQNPNIDGILIVANTGGGEAMSGQILKNALLDSEKPVVVLAHYLGSAGVMGTLTATEIMASGSFSKIGSIGAYITINKNFAEFYKANYVDIYSDKSPEKNKDFRELLKGNIEPLKKYVTELDEAFMSEVKKYRNLKGDVKETLLGGMFSSRDAKRRGLVDSIGTFNDAINRLNTHIANKKKRKYNKK